MSASDLRMSASRRGLVPLQASTTGAWYLWLLLYVSAGAMLAVWFTLEPWLKALTCWAVTPLAFYLFTPIGGATQLWRYLSAFLLVHQSGSPGSLALHLGTTYDVLWRLRRVRRPGERLFQTMHRELYQGLCSFCVEVRAGKIRPETPVTACSYFLTPKQMARYGFQEIPTPVSKKLYFAVGYPEVLLQQWLITGRVRLYHPTRVRCFQATAEEIALRHTYFERLAARHEPAP